MLKVRSLTFLPALRRLDLSKNDLIETGAVSSCTTLKWLSLASNRISNISALSSLSQLQVATYPFKASITQRVWEWLIVDSLLLTTNQLLLSDVPALYEFDPCCHRLLFPGMQLWCFSSLQSLVSRCRSWLCKPRSKHSNQVVDPKSGLQLVCAKHLHSLS